jgi:hypothetical protein
VNGKYAGSAWGSPWEVEIPRDILNEKGNTLEIDVTNSWANRLIGDEQHPSDCSYIRPPLKIGTVLESYPTWFAKGMKSRPSKNRRCFVTWNYFTAESNLTPSGLTKVNLIFAE